MKQDEKSLILDTNIIQYSSDKFAANTFSAFLSELKHEKYISYISSITIYELLKGAHKKIESEMLTTLSILKRIGISDSILYIAAQIETLYKLDGIMPAQIEHGDKIIAATAILSNSSIVTANARDFPYPFFIERQRKLLEFETTRKRYKVIPVSVLHPDLEIVNKKILEIPE